MREIKFRAWDPTRKRMVYRGLFDKNWYYTERNDENGTNLAYGISQRDQVTLKTMQFTGLLDKNGKEIYEGDIVEFDDLEYCGNLNKEKAEVIFDEGSSLVEFMDCNSGKSQEYLFTYNKYIAIIGNIYENPELLKENQPDAN